MPPGTVVAVVEEDMAVVVEVDIAVAVVEEATLVEVEVELELRPRANPPVREEDSPVPV